MKKPHFGAVCHLLRGTLEAIKDDVPPGTHQLGDLEVTFTLPPFAAVMREEGTAGDGWDKGAPIEAPGPPVLVVSLAAVLLYLAKCGVPGGKKAQSRWDEAIRESLKLTDVPLPIEAVSALAGVQAEQVAPAWTPPEPTKTKTPRTRAGAKEVQIHVRRLAKAGVKAE